MNTSNPSTWTVIAIAGAYLLGSIPFSYLIARAWGVDVRKAGSGNVGATNVLRTTGRLPGLLALVLDAVKGVGAVLLARSVEPATLPAMAAVAVVLGHLFPVWLWFRGGKGVATGAGAFLVLAPSATAGAVGLFLVVFATTRYVSVGSMSASVGLAILAFVLDGADPVSWAAAAVAALIVAKHRGNLARLIRGTESRWGGRRPAAEPEPPGDRQGAGS